MRYILTLTLTMVFAGGAIAGSPDSWNHRSEPAPRQVGAHPAYDSREGGENISSAIVVPGDVNLLPFHDTGATCDNVNDYDEACPYAGSTSPDVLYSFTPSEDIVAVIDLCASAYDTKVYVYDAAQNLIACDDDGCGTSGFQSVIYGLSLTGGSTYYIVIDGYGGDCGAYDLTVDRRNCVVECPPDAQIEGEPPCEDGYADVFNSGCNSSTLQWSALDVRSDGCAIVCGQSCTYIWNGSSYRDTDWYDATASGGMVTFTCQAEFPLQIILFQWTYCTDFPYLYALAPACSPAELSHAFTHGQELWLWVGPQFYGDIPESNYVFTVCGLASVSTPVEQTSWGIIKSRYRGTKE